MLGSEHEGERAAAALRASNMLKDNKMTWDQVFKIQVVYRDRIVYKDRYQAAPGQEQSWYVLCANMMREDAYRNFLSMNEKAFVYECVSLRHRLPPEKESRLRQMFTKYNIKAT